MHPVSFKETKFEFGKNLYFISKFYFVFSSVHPLSSFIILVTFSIF